MSTQHLSPQEWQALSAYLDGQLSARERRQVETRLQARAELRTDLEELRQTRSVLRSLPKRRAPRNFTLTPAMVASLGGKRPQPRRAYPFFRLASALASFLLVMTFLGDLAIGATIRNLATSRQAAPMAADSTGVTDFGQPQGTALAQQAPAAPAPTPTPEIAVFSESYPAPAAGPEDQSPTETPAAETMLAVPQEPVLDPTIIARMTAAPPGMGGGVEDIPPPSGMGAAGENPTEDPSVFMKAAPTASPEPAQASSPASEASPPPPDGRMMIPSPEPTLLPEAEIPPTEALPMPELQAQAEPNLAMTEEEARGSADPRSVLRPIEWILGIIAVLTGLAALYLRGKPNL